MKLSKKKIILLLITCLFLYLVFKNLDFRELIQLIQEFELKYIFFLICSIIISLSFRGLCFQLLISQTVKAPLKDLVPLCLTGSALNIVLPARAGDIFRAVYVGAKYNADKVKIFGTVMLERIFDGLMILAMLLSAIFLYNKNPLAEKLCFAAAIIFIGSLIFAFFTIKFNKTDLIFSFLENKCNLLQGKLKDFFISMIQSSNQICNSFINGFEILKYPNKLFLIILASIGIWSFECLNYYIVIQGFHCDISWSVVLFIIGFIALACMIPSASIFIGPYQLAVIAAFSIYGIEKETALAISLVEQSVVLITTAVIALIFFFKNDIKYEDLKKKNIIQ